MDAAKKANRKQRNKEHAAASRKRKKDETEELQREVGASSVCLELP